jgi:hypothetical protein
MRRALAHVLAVAVSVLASRPPHIALARTYSYAVDLDVQMDYTSQEELRPELPDFTSGLAAAAGVDSSQIVIVGIDSYEKTWPPKVDMQIAVVVPDNSTAEAGLRQAHAQSPCTARPPD